MNQSEAIEYFDRRNADRRRGDRRMTPVERAEDAFDAAKVKAAERIFDLLNGVARPAGAGGFVMDDVKEILTEAGFVFVGGGAPAVS
jgi:hypothetical protein